MCVPAAIGIATAVLGAVQSIAGFQGQSQAAKASERAYQEQRNLNAQAANTAYQQAQLKLKGEFDQAAQKSEQLLVDRLQAQGTTLAAGRGGQSISSLLADAQRVEGKDLGSLAMNLANTQQDYFFSAQNIFQQQQNANVSAASQRIAAPSIGGLALELGGAALSGASAYASLKAPKAGGGEEKGKGSSSGGGGERGSSQYQPGSGSQLVPSLRDATDYSGQFKPKKT